MDAEVFGSFIKQCRHDLCISQSELAEKLHVTAKAVSRWERGVGFPDIKLLQPLADALEITIVELMQSKRIEADIPKEEAADLVTGTVDSLRQQEKLSRSKKRTLVFGAFLIGSAASFLYCIGLYYDFSPKWIGSIIKLIAVIGGVWSYRALNSIVTRTNMLTKNSVWRTKKPWIAIGISATAFVILLCFRDSVIHGSLVQALVLAAAFLLLLPGAVYYAKFIRNEHDE